MSNPDKPQQPQKWAYDLTEEDLLLVVSEDKRPIRLGIDPDLSEIEIYLELKRRIAAREVADESSEEE